MLDWHLLLSAVGLVFILEGLLPFIKPDVSKKIFIAAAKMPLNQLRSIGLSSIVVGVLVLFMTQ